MFGHVYVKLDHFGSFDDSRPTHRRDQVLALLTISSLIFIPFILALIIDHLRRLR